VSILVRHIPTMRLIPGWIIYWRIIILLNANNNCNNQINTQCTPGFSDNYAKGDYANDMGRQNTLPYNDNIDTKMVLEFKPMDESASYTHNEIYTQVDRIIDNSSHKNIFNHPNNQGNNKLNTISPVLLLTILS
jgi:hypothetical protein